jgi:uncharacterized sulfatase
MKIPEFLPDCPTIRQDFLDYHREIEWQDAHLVRMLDYLEEIGELDNTIIVVTSDNGIQMPRGITTLYDYGVRVPLAVRWGRVPNPGRVVDDFVNLTDLAPTFLDAAGLEIPAEMTGRSILSILLSSKEGRVDNSRDCVVCGIERHTLCRPHELPYPSRMIRTDEYLYVRNFEPDRWPAGAPDYRAAAQGYYGDVDKGPTKEWMLELAEEESVRPQFQLCFGKRPAEELYAVNNDPDQSRNLASDPDSEAVLSELRTRMETYLRMTQDPRMEGRSPWDHYPYHSSRIRGREGQITNKRVIPARGS